MDLSLIFAAVAIVGYSRTRYLRDRKGGTSAKLKVAYLWWKSLLTPFIKNSAVGQSLCCT